MINLAVLLFGGVWKLKGTCIRFKGTVLGKILAKIYTLYLQSKGSYIGISSTFASPPVFPHGIYGIFISGEAKIGEDCVIFQHVTIGSNTLIDSKGLGAPTIGDRCYLGAGAMVIGNVNVGNDVRVGANANVYQDVENNSVVITQPTRVIIRPSNNNRFYSKRDGKWSYFTKGVWHLEENPEALALLKGAFRD